MHTAGLLQHSRKPSQTQYHSMKKLQQTFQRTNSDQSQGSIYLWIIDKCEQNSAPFDTVPNAGKSGWIYFVNYSFRNTDSLKKIGVFAW